MSEFQPPDDIDPRDDAERLEDAHRNGHHFWHEGLACDGREHYYPCVFDGCNARRYFCKHTSDHDRHCPRNAQRRGG